LGKITTRRKRNFAGQGNRRAQTKNRRPIFTAAVPEQANIRAGKNLRELKRKIATKKNPK
jgi:hypothetical protein